MAVHGWDMQTKAWLYTAIYTTDIHAYTRDRKPDGPYNAEIYSRFPSHAVNHHPCTPANEPQTVSTGPTESSTTQVYYTLWHCSCPIRCPNSLPPSLPVQTSAARLAP